ncbi:MAG: hypothetical protein C0403_09155 [Desulfobacterium sp.]|nr:hypothetical protein [Desulfobacterium sp.]
MKKKMMIVIACFILGLMLDASVFAKQGHESNDNPKMAIPATASEIFTAVDMRVKDLENIIAANTLEKVHVAAFEIRDLLLALPEKPNTLSEEGKKALKSSLRIIKQQAGLLDKYGDANDMAQTKAVFRKYKEEIEKIKKMPDLKP